MSYKIGEFVKIVDTSGHGFKMGEIVKVVKQGDYFFDAENGAGKTQLLRLENVEKIMEGKRMEEKVAVGKFVKVTTAVCYSDKPFVGKIFRVTEYDGGSFWILDGVKDKAGNNIAMIEAQLEVVEAPETKPEVTTCPFQVGDLVAPTGEADLKYVVTNTKMKLAEVLEVTPDNILIKVLEHSSSEYKGNEYIVTPSAFTLVKAISKKYPKIEYTNGIKQVFNPPYTIVEVMVDGRKFSGKSKCMKGDTFDEVTGKAFAMERLAKNLIDYITY